MDDRSSDEPAVNVAPWERWFSGAAALGLIVYGFTRPSWRRAALIAVGLGLGYRALRGHCRVYGSLGVDTADRLASATTAAVVTITRPPAEVYARLKDAESLPAVLEFVEEFRSLGAAEYEVRAHPRGPATTIWRVTVTADRPGELLAWRASAYGKPGHSGQVMFRAAPDGAATEVEVQIRQEGAASPAGVLAEHTNSLNWRTRVEGALQRLKAHLEAK